MRVRVLTSNNKAVESFKGYALAFHPDASKSLPVQQYSPGEEAITETTSLMLLHRDMDVFCNALMDGDVHYPGITGFLKMSLTIAPVLGESQPSRYSTPLNACFSSKTQKKTMLAPFRTALRGFKSIKIGGYVDESLAREVEDEIRQDRWCEPK